MISEGSCDTEDWRNGADKNSALHHRKKKNIGYIIVYSNRKLSFTLKILLV